MHFIGIDIGTSSICGVAYNFSTKETESITKENDTYITSPNQWERAQDAKTILSIVLDIIHDFQAKYSDIKGIGMTGQMHGIVYVDADGEAVSPLYTWQDNRGNLSYKDNLSYAAFLTANTGSSVSSGFGLVTHFYNLKNELVPTDAVKLCTIMDYVVMKLAGKNTPLTDYSNAASLGFFKKDQLIFDIPSLQKAGINASILPDMGESASFVGLFEEIPVYSAIGDNQASFLGSVHDVEHSIHVTVGTSSQISVYSDKYIEVESLETRPLPGGGYILVGATLCGGSSFAMLKNFFADTLAFFLEKEGKEAIDDLSLYQKMTSIPFQAHVDEDLIVETFFDGTRLQPEKRGEITNISLSNLTPENVILGFLKGISETLYNFYQLIPESLKNDKTLLIGSGNGIKKNPLLCEAFEERFQHSMHLSAIQEEAAFGACMCAIVGGKYSEHFIH